MFKQMYLGIWADQLPSVLICKQKDGTLLIFNDIFGLSAWENFYSKDTIILSGDSAKMFINPKTRKLAKILYL